MNLKINELIKLSREDVGLTQVVMAQKLGIARQTYLDLETGKTEPRYSMIIRLSIVTDKSISFFFNTKFDRSKEYDKNKIAIKFQKIQRELVEVRNLVRDF